MTEMSIEKCVEAAMADLKGKPHIGAEEVRSRVQAAAEVYKMTLNKEGDEVEFSRDDGLIVRGRLHGVGDAFCLVRHYDPEAGKEREYIVAPSKLRRISPEPAASKPTNPKDALGIGKAPLSCVPANALLSLGVVMLLGARKYGRHNWREKGVRSSVYYDAAMRHLMAWWEGEDLDQESGQSHLAHAMACLAIVLDARDCGKLEDDRPSRTPPEDWLETRNKAAKALVEFTVP